MFMSRSSTFMNTKLTGALRWALRATREALQLKRRLERKAEEGGSVGAHSQIVITPVPIFPTTSAISIT